MTAGEVGSPFTIGQMCAPAHYQHMQFFFNSLTCFSSPHACKCIATVQLKKRREKTTKRLAGLVFLWRHEIEGTFFFFWPMDSRVRIGSQGLGPVQNRSVICHACLTSATPIHPFIHSFIHPSIHAPKSNNSVRTSKKNPLRAACISHLANNG